MSQRELMVQGLCRILNPAREKEMRTGVSKCSGVVLVVKKIIGKEQDGIIHCNCIPSINLPKNYKQRKNNY